MENIIEPNESFDFANITLAHPTGIQGSAYFTKIEYNKKPLYIQTTKSLTRQGIVKSGKKYHCDLMFNNEAESLINWFENLEDTCQKLIYNKSESWFQNTLEMTDIETAFNSTIRVYKSGKYYLVRTNVRNSPVTNEPVIKIYDENEIPLNISDVTNETNIISILELQGIKFTSRNFQIEIELKQIMVLNNEPIFDNCLIKTNKINKNDHIKQSQQNTIIENVEIIESIELDTIDKNIREQQDQVPLDILEKSILDTNNIDEFHKNKMNNIETIDNTVVNTIDNTVVNLDVIEETNEVTNEVTNELTNEVTNEVTNEDLLLEIEELDLETFTEQKDLKEINLDITEDNDLDTYTLKKPNQVYFELYKEARKKAKVAKKMAILAYLEAKNIKKNYMIENLNDSDSDFDAEIDEISESELEGL